MGREPRGVARNLFRLIVVIGNASRALQARIKSGKNTALRGRLGSIAKAAPSSANLAVGLTICRVTPTMFG